MLRRPAHIIANKQIQQPVAIEIEPQRRRAECAPPPQPRMLRNIHKRATPRIAKQPVLPYRSDIDIRKAVVIVIGHGNAQPIHLHGQPRALRHIRERPVTIIAIQLQRAPLPLMPRPVAPVHEQNIEPAVVIVIEKRAPGPHRLRQIFRPISAAVMTKPNPGRTSHVRQTKPKRRRRRTNQRSGASRDKRPSCERRTQAKPQPTQVAQASACGVERSSTSIPRNALLCHPPRAKLNPRHAAVLRKAES